MGYANINDNDSLGFKGYCAIGLAVFGVLFVLVMLFTSWGTVESGSKGVYLHFGGVTGEVLNEGFYFKVPFVDSVVLMSTRVKREDTAIEAASKDLQTVTAAVALNYHIDTSNIAETYKRIGDAARFEPNINQPIIQETSRATISKYTAEELITQRIKVKEEMEIAVRERLAPYGILVDSVSLVNFDFSPTFNAAIEAKVTAEQNALAQKNKLEQVKYEAEQRVTTATAEAEAIKIQAQAIQAQGGVAYVSLKAVEKWDGKLPVYNNGGALPFLDINSVK